MLYSIYKSSCFVDDSGGAYLNNILKSYIISYHNNDVLQNFDGVVIFSTT